MKRICLCLALLALPLGALRADIVVPSGTENGGLTTIFGTGPRTYGEFIGASEFAAITMPVLFTGMQIRLATLPGGGANWPSADVIFSQYDLQLSQASTAISAAGGNWSGLTFAQAQGAGVTTVRSGGLTIPANSFVYDGGTTPDNPNSFTFSITFTTPFLYTPGTDLVLLVSHTGSGVAGTPSFAGQAFINGVVSGAFASSAGAASPGTINVPGFVVNFQGAFVPEPSSYGLVLTAIALFGALAVLTRRRRRTQSAES